MPNEQKAKRQLRDADAIPAWKKNSVERSLTSARERAQDRSDRFVAAAMELMQERGTTDFTVQEVIDRSRMSIRTFYKFFASKDDLLVAVHDTILAREVVPRLRRRCEVTSDPVERVRAYIEGLYDLTADRNPASRALTTFRSRLAETRPNDLEQTMRPQIELVVELVSRSGGDWPAEVRPRPRGRRAADAPHRPGRPCTPGSWAATPYRRRTSGGSAHRASASPTTTRACTETLDPLRVSGTSLRPVA